MGHHFPLFSAAPKPTKMATIINSIESLSLKPQFRCYSNKQNPNFQKLLSNFSTRLASLNSKHHQWHPVKCCISNREIEMVKTRDGLYTAKAKKVVVLWDLDNKPPRGPPYEAALALKSMAQKLGEVIEMSAYANRHAFVHLPQWVVEERRERRQLDFLERKGIAKPPDPYICSVCGRKCKTNMDLKRHFKQLHERERQKKLNRMKSLKGKKRQSYKQRFIDGNDKYNDAARSLLTPKIGYGLAQELKRAGVYVKEVRDKPQAADWALKKQIMHSMSSGVDWIVLVSDDSDFSDMLRKAREVNLGTVVVGDQDRALGRHADVWLPWIRVENGEITEESLREFDERRSGRFSVSEFDGEWESAERSLDGVIQLVEFNGRRVSSFDDDDDRIRRRMDEWDSSDEEDYLLDSEDDEIQEENDVYF